MVDPDDYLPPGVVRTQVVPPTTWQRLRARYDGPVLATAFVSAGVTVWTVAVAGRGAQPVWGMLSGLLVTMGLFAVVRPAWGFAFGERWTYREDPEPSRAYLVLTRAGGVAMLVGGLVLGLAVTPTTPPTEPEGPGSGLTEPTMTWEP